MDDHELEQRLRTHLHRRFDVAAPSPELAASVAQVFATRPRRLGTSGISLRMPALRWAAIAVTLVVAAGVVVQLGGFIAPGATPVPTPGRSLDIPTGRLFLVIPSTREVPAAADTEAAVAVLIRRLQALGIESVDSSVGIGIELEVPTGEPLDDAIIDVLGATGDLRFVPLPPESYGPGGAPAAIGEPLPVDAPALLGRADVESISRAEPTGLVVSLRPEAAEAFATFTREHVGETMAVMIDDRVALLPMIQSEIANGEIVLQPGADSADILDEITAILMGGKLPDAWADPVVPDLMPVEEIIAVAQRELDLVGSDARLVSVELDVIPEDDGFWWHEVWRLTYEGSFPQSCPAMPPGASPCHPADTLTTTFDASTGEGIGSVFE